MGAFGPEPDTFAHVFPTCNTNKKSMPEVFTAKFYPWSNNEGRQTYPIKEPSCITLGSPGTADTDTVQGKIRVLHRIHRKVLGTTVTYISARRCCKVTPYV